MRDVRHDVIFLTGVSNFDYFWKVFLVSIFGKFRKTFGPSKPLFSFGPVLTVDNFWLSTFDFPEISKISGKRMALVSKAIFCFSPVFFSNLRPPLLLSLSLSLSLSNNSSLLSCSSQVLLYSPLSLPLSNNSGLFSLSLFPDIILDHHHYLM